MSSPTTVSESAPSFEAALAELEQIVANLETGQMPLEQALAAYKRGAVLLQFAQAQLRNAEQQVQILEGNVLRPVSAEDAGRPES
jgi:exodeoxyribonuclease VII small subunit